MEALDELFIKFMCRQLVGLTYGAVKKCQEPISVF
jgi:hypothetical protein